MNNEVEFVDYYHVLQVEPECDARTLELAYHYFAKLYHPDNHDTQDVDKFTRVVEAYKALENPALRADYDRQYFALKGLQRATIGDPSSAPIDDATALGDAEVHHRILLKLYRRRREHPLDAGVVGWLMQETLGCSDEEFAFHVWYLKAKGYLAITEQGTLEITIDGVDHVITSSQRTAAEPRLIPHSSPSAD